MTKTANSSVAIAPENGAAGSAAPSEPLPSPAARRILLVEDEESHAEIIRRSFERRGAPFQLTTTGSVAEAAQAIDRIAFDLVISDWRLPDGDGFELLTDKSRFPLLIMTSHGSERIAVEAMRAGALDYVVKSESSLLEMPRIAEDAIRLWESRAARELAQEKLRIAEEELREHAKEEAWLRKSEHSLRTLADAIPQIVWTSHADGSVNYYNHRWYEFTGFPIGAEAERSWAPIIHLDDLPAVMERWQASLNSGAPFEIQCRYRDRKSGGYRWHLVRALPLKDEQGTIESWVGSATDIDDNKRLNEELERRVEERTANLRRVLEEKTVLLQEVHHRVKNNLQVVCSLLTMQIAASGTDSISANSLNDAHSRVLAMSLVHEQIYQSETLADLDFKSYAGLLAERLFSAYCVDPAHIRLETDVEAVPLTVTDAIPCGLILNELVSNSLKHAFRGRTQGGVIRISFRKTENDVELAVTDNGIGMPAGFRPEASESLGMRVVSALARQLRADCSIGSNGGATFRLRWKPHQAAA